jgi:hypothetical protein
MSTNNHFFQRYFLQIGLGSGLFLLLLLGFSFWYRNDTKTPIDAPQTDWKAVFSKLDHPTKKLSRSEKKLAKKARADYWFYRLRDPKTNEIPQGIRMAELAYAATLPKKDYRKGRTEDDLPFLWQEVGPADVGGRTRAFAQDLRNPNIMIAGGASGGIWKSTDRGASWQSKTEKNYNLSVTSLAQDPINLDTWYYSMGELVGNSASDRGFKAFYGGSGLFKSSDNGETWSYLQYEALSLPTTWKRVSNPTTSFTNNRRNAFNYTLRIALSPTTGTIFVAANGYGILRSTDGGETFTLVLGAMEESQIGRHTFSDVALSANGDLVASLSGKASEGAGIYRSTDDGQSWQNITPDNFPLEHERTLLAFAPSNPAVFYSFTNTGNSLSGIESPYTVEDSRFFYYNLQANRAEDRSANIPNYGNVGVMALQGNYNMVLAVKPDDENFVLIGGINLFRSTTGFSEPVDLNNPARNWIGGFYSDNRGGYGDDNHHPDQQALWFDVQNPNILISCTDGGLSRTTITDAHVVWESLNNGYNVTQFYTVAIANWADLTMGGCQDNGSPVMEFGSPQNSLSPKLYDLTKADGAFCAFDVKNRIIYASSQNGFMARFRLVGNDIIWSYLYPEEAENQSFINPFILDPSDNNKMYYLGGRTVWRQDDLKAIPDYVVGTKQGWKRAASINPGRDYFISAIEVSQKNPAHVLYLAASSYYDIAPKLYRLDEAHTAEFGTPTELPLPADIPRGAFISNISVNPENADELMISISNYNVVSLYHSLDGGASFRAVEGNLAGSQTLPGPSVRWATIYSFKGKTLYLAGTSIGLYSCQNLAGDQTEWVLESPDLIGNSVVTMMQYRQKDGAIAVGTHGRGIYVGFPDAALFEGLNAPLWIEASNITDKGANLDWENVAEATSYELQIATDARFSQLVAPYNPKTVSQNFTLLNDLQANTFYYARVRAKNGNRVSFYSNTASFKTLESQNPTAVEDLVASQKVLLYPNPAPDAVQLRFETQEFDSQVWHLTLLDAKGSILFKKVGTLPLLNAYLKSQTPSLKQGAYLLQIRGEKNNKQYGANLRFVKAGRL